MWQVSKSYEVNVFIKMRTLETKDGGSPITSNIFQEKNHIYFKIFKI